MRELLSIIAFVIGIVWLDLLIREQDDRVALLFCCLEQLHFFQSERLGRLSKDQIGMSACLLQFVGHRLHIFHIFGINFAASAFRFAESPPYFPTIMFDDHEVDFAWRNASAAPSGENWYLPFIFLIASAAAHIVAQVAKWQRRSVFAFTRPGDVATQGFARSLGAEWAGGSDEMPPEPLDAAIIFATLGDLVPLALKAVRKGGRVVCAGIHMSDIPSFPYQIIWEERALLSVANLTRQDGIEFLRVAPKIGIVTKTTSYPLNQANQALADLRAGRFDGAAVLVP